MKRNRDTGVAKGPMVLCFAVKYKINPTHKSWGGQTSIRSDCETNAIGAFNEAYPECVLWSIAEVNRLPEKLILPDMRDVERKWYKREIKPKRLRV